MPPIADYLLQVFWLTHCYRGQAPSHMGFMLSLHFLRSDQTLQKMTPKSHFPASPRPHGKLCSDQK